MQRRVRRFLAACLVPLGIVGGAMVAVGFSDVPSGAAGILPPANPAANITPDSGDWLTSVDDARTQEGLGPLNLSESSLAVLPLPEQLFAVVNIERVDRGLPPIDDMTTQLDADADAGANSGVDPAFPASLAGGVPLTFGGSIWAGGLTSVLEADYYWMYDDGWSGPSTTNATCSPQAPSGCWGHRDIILHPFADCSEGPPVLSMGAAYSASGYRGGSIAAVMVGSCAPPGDIVATWSQVSATLASSSHTVGIATVQDGTGYWEVEANGTVSAFGSALRAGSLTRPPNSPVVGITATPDGGGYWLVASDGGVFSFGDARFFGSTGSLRLNQPIVGMAGTADGGGYWLVASDGGVFSFGDAAFHGSMGGSPLNRSVVGIAADWATGGYWEVAADGGIFSFDAPFLGSTGGLRLNEPIVGMEAAPGGTGYRFVAADGGVFSFGSDAFEGSTGNEGLVAPVVGMASDGASHGYWLAASDGGIFSFGGAPYMGRQIGSPG